MFELERIGNKKKTFQNTNHLLEKEKCEKFGDLFHLYRNNCEKLKLILVEVNLYGYSVELEVDRKAYLTILNSKKFDII